MRESEGEGGRRERVREMYKKRDRGREEREIERGGIEGESEGARVRESEGERVRGREGGGER